MTLKAFKAAVQVRTKITVLDHWLPKYLNTVRTVTKVQGNGFYFTTPGVPSRSWSPYPKSSELRFDGQVAHVCMGDKFWVLAFEPADGKSYADRVSETDRAHPCKYGHLDCSTRDGGPCVDEVMSAAEVAP